jgi:hypothetical protein
MTPGDADRILDGAKTVDLPVQALETLRLPVHMRGAC